MEMTEKEKVEIIEEALSSDILAGYLTAEWGEKLGVYADGETAIGQSVGKEIAEDERPIAIAKCPGIGNIERAYWIDDLVATDEGGLYKTAGGQEMTLEECVIDCCENGDVTPYMDDLREKLLEDMREDMREEY